MKKDEVLKHLEHALDWVNEIDLRGQRRGTTVHTAVTKSHGALTKAIYDLTEEEPS